MPGDPARSVQRGARGSFEPKEKIMDLKEKIMDCKDCESCKNYEAKEEDETEDVKVDFTSEFIQLRSSGNYKNRAFYLRRYYYDWEIKEDEEGALILVPTPK